MFLLAFSESFLVCVCRSFPSLVFPAQRSSFSICCKAGWVVLNSLNFCLSVKVLISPSNLNEILAGQSNLRSRFFSFMTLSISCHSLLACRISAERSTVNLMGIPLCVFCCFSLAAFNMFSLYLIFDSLINMCQDYTMGKGQFSQQHLLKRLSFPHCVVLAHLSKIS